MKLIPFILVFVISACVHDYQFKAVEPYFILHNNSSNVWIIDKELVNNKNITPFNLEEKKMMVFHKDLNCFQYNVKDLGLKKGKIGTFSMHSKDKKFFIQTRSSLLTFKIIELNEEKIILQKNKNKDTIVRLELIPFPAY